jgi:hypothetical protein
LPFAWSVNDGRPWPSVVELTWPRIVTWTSGASDAFGARVASDPWPDAAGAAEGAGEAARTGNATAIASTATARMAAGLRGERVRKRFTGRV